VRNSQLIRKRIAMKVRTTWILVANGTHGFIARNLGPGHGIERALEREFHGPNIPDRDIMSDAPGWVFDSAGRGRHAMERPTDPQRHNQRVFARQIAVHIDKAADRKEFDRLVLVAAPHMLGEIRKYMSNAVKAKVTGELPKDLTHLPMQKLPDHLGEIMAI
jgi:protein required for attachment to host cells